MSRGAMRLAPAGALWLLACLALPAHAAPPASGEADKPKVAIFDFELYDTSLEGEMRGPDPLEAERLDMITELVRDAYEARGETVLVDVSPLRERLDTMPQLRTCKGCETTLAEPLGADRTVTGFVQKISTLILSVSVYVRDVETGELIHTTSASIRGNTDESWAHGVNYIIRHNLFPEDEAAAGEL